MRLRRLDLTRYGKFTDHSIDFGEHVPGTPDFHIVYGLNEAGKSTSLAGYLDLLFGIEERTRYGFLHQGKAMEIGACLEFDGRAHEFKRVKQRSNSLLNEHGQTVNEAILSVPLAGLTRDAYRMMFSLDDQTLEEGGNAILESKGDLGELLFSASAGLAGVSAILEAAVDEADDIFRKRASSTRIAGLKRQIGELKARRDEIDIQASAYKALTTALHQASAAYEDVIREVGSVKARQAEITRVLRAHPLLADYLRGQAELRECTDLPHPPTEWATALPDLIDEDTRLQTRLAGIEQREQKIREELEQLVVDKELLEMADCFHQLSEAAARYSTAEEDLPKRRNSRTEWTRKVDLILAALGQPDVADPKTLLIPAATIGSLRDLITERSGIDVARQSAEKEYEVAQQALEKEQRARRALDSLGAAIDTGTVALLQSVLSRLRESDLAAELRLAERSLPEKEQAFTAAVAALYPWTGDGDTIHKISAPHGERIGAWKADLTAMDKRRLQTLERENELATKRDEDTARIAALHDVAGVVDDDAAAAVLAERDKAWTEHLATLDVETAHDFEGEMRKTDAIMTARLGNAKALEELRSLTATLAITKANLNRQSEVLDKIDAESEALRAEIKASTPAEIELPADAPLAAWLIRLERWTESYASALEKWDGLQHARREVERARQALETEQNALSKALATIGIADDGFPLAALIQAAENALGENATLLTKRMEAAGRLDELETAAVERKMAHEKAVNASQEWHRAWSTCLTNTWFSDRQESVGAIRALLDAIANLPEALRELDDLQHRIDAMEADRQMFADAVADLHAALGDAPDGKDPLAAARALIRRHGDQAQIQTRREERLKALADLSVEREKLAGEMSVHEARKKEMTDVFGVGTLGFVRQALERCWKRDALVEQQNKIERQIIGEMQAQSLYDATLALANADLHELQREEAELAKRLEDLDGRSKTLFAEKAKATDRLEAIGGDDAVARVEAARKTAMLEVEDLALRYLRLKSGSLIAEQALRSYRDKHRSAMMNRASEAFRLITRDEYSGLATRPEKDREALIGLSRHGGSKLAIDMSKGTRFQLYLALRLAGYEEFATARPSVPFLADDIMETFDEPRSEEVFRLFGQMAQVGQTIYLTHHRHLCEIATQVVPGVRVHEIA